MLGTMNVKRREIPGQTAIDVGKYLLTAIAVGAVVKGDLPLADSLNAAMYAVFSIIVGLMIIPRES